MLMTSPNTPERRARGKLGSHGLLQVECVPLQEAPYGISEHRDRCHLVKITIEWETRSFSTDVKLDQPTVVNRVSVCLFISGA